MDDKAKAPAFQWYPSDARSDTALRMCSIAARGLWYELLWIMHNGEPRGYLGVKGRVIPPPALAGLTGVSLDLFTTLLEELERFDVFSRRPEDGMIYSRRMVRDTLRAEQARQWGAKGGPETWRRNRPASPPDDVDEGVQGTLNLDLSPSLKMKMKMKNEDEGEGRKGDRGKPDPVVILFDDWWTRYGKDVGKGEAFAVWCSLDDDERRACINTVDRYTAARVVGFRKDPVNYLTGQCWRDAIVSRAEGQKSAAAPIVVAARIATAPRGKYFDEQIEEMRKRKQA